MKLVVAVIAVALAYAQGGSILSWMRGSFAEEAPKEVRCVIEGTSLTIPCPRSCGKKKNHGCIDAGAISRDLWEEFRRRFRSIS